MNEREFVSILQQRAKEQKQVLQSMPFPRFYAFVAEWLGNHPWRFLIPLAFFVSLLLRFAFGKAYPDFVLLLFRKI